LAAGLQCRVVDRLKDISVQLLCLVTLKRKAHHEKCVSKTLNADADRSMALVALLRLRKQTKNPSK